MGKVDGCLVLKMEYRITALKAQKRNPNRVNVYLDGEFAFGLARIVAAWLSIGQELGEEQIAELQRKDTDEVAFQAALRYLNYRARTEAEIRQHLKEKAYSEIAVESVIERLRHDRLLDDQQFAQMWVENQTTFRPRGRRALAFELRHKGVSENDIEQALSQSAAEDELAYQAAQKQAPRLSRFEWPEFRLKLSQFLARRGFSYETISPTVRRMWAERNAPQDDLTAGEPKPLDEE